MCVNKPVTRAYKKKCYTAVHEKTVTRPYGKKASTAMPEKS